MSPGPLETLGPILVGVVIVVGITFLMLYIRQRHWNVDHEDDEVREGQVMILLSEDEEEGE